MPHKKFNELIIDNTDELIVFSIGANCEVCFAM